MKARVKVSQHWILVLSLALAMALTGCSQAPVSPRQDTLDFMLPGEPQSLDPSYSSEIYGTQIIAHLYEPLVRIDSNGALVPAGAEGWEIDQENMRFTFKIRSGNRWSDGALVTAQDYRAGMLRVLSPEVKSANASYLTPYVLNAKAYASGQVAADDVGITAEGMTLTITTSVPTPYLLEILCYMAFSPISSNMAKEQHSEWSTQPEKTLTNGPFILSEYKSGAFALLKRNPYYWNQDKVKLSTIKFSFRTEDTDVVDLYNSGEVDGLYEIKAAEMRRIPNGELDAITSDLASTAYLAANHLDERFQHRDMREAVSRAIDRAGLVDKILYGAGTPSQYFVPFSYKVNGQRFRDYTALDSGKDLARATALLDGLKGQGIDLSGAIPLYYMENGPDDESAKYIAKQLGEDLGLKLEPIGLPWSELYDIAIHKPYGILMIGWSADFPHPMTFLGNFGSQGVLSDVSRWYSADYDAALQAYLSADKDQQLGKLRAMEDLILEDYHLIPLYHRKGLSILSSSLKNWYRNPSSQFIFTEAYFE